MRPARTVGDMSSKNKGGREAKKPKQAKKAAVARPTIAQKIESAKKT